MPNLYETLGIQKDAAVEEIRRAYKDLARQKHPDRGGDPEEFKKIQEAHEILTDESRRRMYDLTGSTSDQPMASHPGQGHPFDFMMGGGGFGMPFDLGSIFGGMFGGGGSPGSGFKRPRAPKGPNKYHDIAITLADFYKGREIRLKFNQARRCEACGATGAEKTEPCGPCGGRGARTIQRMIGPGMIAQQTGPCDICSGDGRRVLKACIICHGKKFNESAKELLVQIRPGMSEGESLVFAGECSDSAEYDAPGDVVLNLRRADPAITDVDCWEWRGTNLTIRKRISYVESVLGFTLRLEGHPSGKNLHVGWKKGPLVHGAILQAPGWGMPDKHNPTQNGTCFVQILVDPPTQQREWSPAEHEYLGILFGTPEFPTDFADIVPLQPSSLDSKTVIDRS